MLLNDSSAIARPFWFIPIDVIIIFCITSSLILAIVFFFIITIDKKCRTVPMLLVGNSYLIGIIFGISIFSINLFRLINDLYHRTSADIFCNFRGYMSYATCSILNFSFCLQAIYRFLRIIYPRRLIFQSWKFQFFLICSTWIFGIVYPMIFLFTNEIIYNLENQICQLPLRLSFLIIYMANSAYIIPVSLTMIIYLKLVYHVRKMTRRVIPVNTLDRARRDLKMLRRTVILVSILIVYCLPYATFIFCSFFLQLPKYHFRISCAFIDTSYLFVMIALFQFTDPLKASIRKLLRRQTNQPGSMVN